jgi:sodium/potassium/calcium exchanger 2
MLVFITIAIHCQGWKLTKVLGAMMFFMYFAFLAVAIILELPFEPC